MPHKCPLAPLNAILEYKKAMPRSEKTGKTAVAEPETAQQAQPKPEKHRGRPPKGEAGYPAFSDSSNGSTPSQKTMGRPRGDQSLPTRALNRPAETRRPKHIQRYTEPIDDDKSKSTTAADATGST